MSKKLYKNEKDNCIFGICAGFADYIGYDVSIIRIFTFILAMAMPIVFWIYIFAAMILPTKN